MNDEVIEKFISIEKEAAEEKGSFVLFGLFEREDTPNMWDVVISASWLDVKKKENYDYFARKITAKLGPQEVVMLSRIVLLAPSEPFVVRVTSAITAEHNNPRFTNSIFNGVFIKDAYIISSKPDASFTHKSK